MDNISDVEDFSNSFQLCQSKLKEENSVAVTDDDLMRALLLQAIDCDDLAVFKRSVLKDLDMKPDKIMSGLKAEYVYWKKGNVVENCILNGDLLSEID